MAAEDGADPADLGLADLHDLVSLGRARLEGLTTPEEEEVCETILGLCGAPGRLYARVTARRLDAYRVEGLQDVVDDVEGAVDLLEAAGLVDGAVSWGQRLSGSTVPVLRRWCRACGLETRGRREDLVARLGEVEPPSVSDRWLRVRHPVLVRRLERVALLDKDADRGVLVAERLGHVTWPAYTPTAGGRLFRDRAHLLAWETALEAHRQGTLGVDAALALIAGGNADAPGRLSLRRRLRRGLVAQAEDLRRAGEHEAALDLVRAVEDVTGEVRGSTVLLRSRLREDLGDGPGALAVLHEARERVHPADRLALARSGRRLARSERRSWPPDPPLRDARTRTLDLDPGAGRGSRPTWRVDGAEYLVEEAVQTVVGASGRSSVRCEGGLIRTLAVVLLHDALFLDVPGMLPVPRLPGPLDLGTPAFGARRPGAIDRVLDDIATGRGPERVARGCAALAGSRIAGVSRALDPPEALVDTARALGPAGLRAVLVPLLASGFGAAAGLPDLLVFPGEPVRVPGHPSRVGPDALFVEVKGPGDSLRDGQRVWIDRLVRAGVPVEVWAVRPTV